MRIEELDNNNFVKLPDRIEKSIINTMNRYFNSDPEFIKGSVEEILTEFAKRIRPMISSICKDALILEKDKLIEKDFTRAIEKNKEKLINELMDIIKKLKKELVKPKKFVQTIEDEKYEICIPKEIKIYNDCDNVKIFVNGILQIENNHYEIIKNDRSEIKKIIFKNLLISRDTVSIEYFDIKIPREEEKTDVKPK